MVVVYYFEVFIFGRVLFVKQNNGLGWPLLRIIMCLLLKVSRNILIIQKNCNLEDKGLITLALSRSTPLLFPPDAFDPPGNI